MPKQKTQPFDPDEPQWEVFKEGVRYASGPMSLIYDEQTRKQMRKCGYKIKVDGKIFRG